MWNSTKRRRLPCAFRPAAAFGVALAACLLSVPARAASRQTQENSARKACLSGDYAKGVSILSDLFMRTKDGTYIFNQGRCFEQNGRYEEAIARFHEFLRTASVATDADKASAEKHIADCEAIIAKQLGRSPNPTPSPVAIAPAPAQPPSPSPPPLPSPLPSPEVESGVMSGPSLVANQTPRANDGRGLRVAGVVAASVGVAVVGTGIGLAVKGNSLSTSDFSRSREDERSSLRTWSLVSYGVGAGAIVTGAVLYLVGWHSQSSSSVALVPAVVPGATSLSLQGSF